MENRVQYRPEMITRLYVSTVVPNIVGAEGPLQKRTTSLSVEMECSALVAELEKCSSLEEAFSKHAVDIASVSTTPGALDQLDEYFARALDLSEVRKEERSLDLDALGPKLLSLKKKQYLRKPDKAVPGVNEADGEPVLHYDYELFENWGDTVVDIFPRHTFVPRTREGVISAVRFALAEGLRVRCAGARHSESPIFGKTGEVLLQFMPLAAAEAAFGKLPIENPQDTPLESVELVRVEEGGETALVKLGAAATTDHYRAWCLSDDGGNWLWMLNALPILVEITNPGWTQPICHGAGKRFPMVSDMVTEIEFVNAKGEVQVVNDPVQLQAASGAFGMFGVILSQTFRLSKMRIAQLKPRDIPTPLAIPPPSRDWVPETDDFDVSKYTDKDLEDARQKMLKEFDKFYVNYYWFPFQGDCWVQNFDTRPFNAAVDPRPVFPTEKDAKLMRAQTSIADIFQKTVLRLLPGVKQARLFGIASMAAQPNDEDVEASVCDALHWRRGTHQYEVVLHEAEIQIPMNESGELEFGVVQQAWWMAIRKVYEAAKDDKAPMRVVLEMRIIGGSNAFLAPNRGNDATLAIEVLTNPITPKEEWNKFVNELTDEWASIKDPTTGKPIKILPHWAKLWPSKIRGKDYLSYMREMYREPAGKFRKSMADIARAGGCNLKDMWDKFGNDDVLDIVAPSRNRLCSLA